MRFFEYESREIVRRAGIPVTKFGFATTVEQAETAAHEIGGAIVIKSQVLSGGRMKAGGVQFADTPKEAAEHTRNILELEIGGQMPRGVLVDSKAEVKQAVELMFEVKVEGVNLLNKPGKTRRFKNVAGKRNGYKKAYVRLETGQSIDFTGASK